MNLYKLNDTSKVIPLYMCDAAAPTGYKAGLGANVYVRVSKNGGNFAPGSGSVAELEGGHYYYTPAAWDLNTLGPIAIRATGLGALDFNSAGRVVAYDPYSSTNMGLSSIPAVNPGSSGGLPVGDSSGRVSANATQIGGNSVVVDGSGLLSVNIVNVGGVGVIGTNQVNTVDKPSFFIR